MLDFSDRFCTFVLTAQDFKGDSGGHSCKKNSALSRRTQPAEKAEFLCKIFSSQAKAYRAMGVFSMRVMSHMARMPSTSRGRPATRPDGLGPYRKFAPSAGSQ